MDSVSFSWFYSIPKNNFPALNIFENNYFSQIAMLIYKTGNKWKKI